MCPFFHEFSPGGWRLAPYARCSLDAFRLTLALLLYSCQSGLHYLCSDILTSFTWRISQCPLSVQMSVKHIKRFLVLAKVFNKMQHQSNDQLIGFWCVQLRWTTKLHSWASEIRDLLLEMFCSRGHTGWSITSQGAMKFIPHPDLKVLIFCH